MVLSNGSGEALSGYSITNGVLGVAIRLILFFIWSRSVVIGNSYYLWVIWYGGNSTAVNGNYAYSLGGVAYITLHGRGVFQFTTLPVISISPILTVVRMTGNI